MSNLKNKYRRLATALGWLTVIAALVIVVIVMAKTRTALGLPPGRASLDGIRLKFLAWLTIILVSIPLSFYLARVLLHGAFGLLMMAAGRFTANEARSFAFQGGYPDAWFDSDTGRSFTTEQALKSTDSRNDTPETLIAGLIAGNQEAVDTFGESHICVVVDWRDGAAEILEALTPFLPPGYLQFKKRGRTKWVVQAGDRPPRTIEFTKDTKQERFFVALNQLLAPDFELWRYTPMDGDGYSLYLAPAAWWRTFADQHPKALAKYFVSVERLAAYWQKSYLARLFSKP